MYDCSYNEAISNIELYISYSSFENNKYLSKLSRNIQDRLTLNVPLENKYNFINKDIHTMIKRVEADISADSYTGLIKTLLNGRNNPILNICQIEAMNHLSEIIILI